MKERIKEKIAEIVEIVETVPQPFKDRAFTELLKFYLEDISNKTLKRSDKSTSDRISDDLKEWEERIFEGLPEPFLVAENGSRDQQAVWAIVSVYKKNKEGATTEKIREVLKNELGVTPQSVSNTARTLRRLVPKYLLRKKEGKGYAYEPNRNSINIFQDLNN